MRLVSIVLLGLQTFDGLLNGNWKWNDNWFSSENWHIE